MICPLLKVQAGGRHWWQPLGVELASQSKRTTTTWRWKPSVGTYKLEHPVKSHLPRSF